VANFSAPDGGNRDKFFPTRLLDLRKLRETGLIRIVSGATVGKQETYMALSHCWGGVYPESLRKITDHDLRTGFDYHRLPLTFLDACLVARELDCFYLWIDALCISQGNEQDWLRESTRMTETFARSELTIAASDSGNPEAGIFRKVELHEAQHIRIPFTCKCKAAIVTGDPLPIGSWTFYEKPLHDRAWVIQEMALSPRVAYFTTTGLYWICMTTIVEEGRQGRPWSTTPVSSQVKPQVPRDIRTWNGLVNVYTSCSLTFSTDRLTAIAGLAGRCQTETKAQLGRYLAGMWETRLAEQLVWTTDGRESRPDFLKKIPTWSWASVAQGVRFHMRASKKGNMDVEIVDILGRSDDQHYMSIDIQLRATAPLLELDVILDRGLAVDEARPLTFRNSIFDDDLKDGEAINDSMIRLCELLLYKHHAKDASNDVQIRASRHELETNDIQGEVRFDEPVQVPINAPMLKTQLLIMLVWKMPVAELSYGYDDWCGLLVQPVDDEPGCFRRVGLIFTEFDIIERWNLKGFRGAGVEQRHLIELV
jgi:hypothetical protein